MKPVPRSYPLPTGTIPGWLSVISCRRALLDAKGLMGEDDLDGLVTEAAARHPATNRPGAPNPDGQIHRRKA